MLIALVPVKELNKAKNRLAARLNPVQRAGLCLAMLSDVVDVLRRSPEVDQVLVTSPDGGVLAHARELGVLAVNDEVGTLNGALKGAIGIAAAMGAAAALLLPGDLPLVTPADIAALVSALPPHGGVVLGPTWDGGTGAMLLSPPGAVEPAYGSRSFHRHLARARRAGLPVETRLLPNLSVDMDRPEDLDHFLQQKTATLTAAFLASIHITDRGDQGCM